MSEHEEIFSNAHLAISKNSYEIFLQTFTSGITTAYLAKLLEYYPQIHITENEGIKKALDGPSKGWIKIGEINDRIRIEVSGDKLNVYLTLCVTEEELNQSFLVKEIILKLSHLGIVYGIQKKTLLEGLVNNQRLLIAKGTMPIHGKDSVMNRYQLKAYKPDIKEDGTVDYYELNLINKVNIGDWLGERIDATKGIHGKTVMGEVIPAVSGKQYPLIYDKKTVKEQYKNGITTLYSLVKGAVHYQGDKIAVSNLLEISGDIDFKTGNIDFDGYVSVKGIVEDNFSVVADKDIEILGTLGVGSVKEIESRSGSVFIKGGIAGKSKAIIKSTVDLYTKYISDATVICEGDLHVSSYCFNSNIIANQVFIDSPNGQIVGGNIEAKMRILSPFIGNSGEKRTVVAIKGFDRKALKEEMEELTNKMSALKLRLVKEKQEAFIYSHGIDHNHENMEKYNNMMQSYLTLKDDLNELQKQLKTKIGYLKIKGEGEVSSQKKIYPNTRMEFKNQVKEIRKETLAACYYFQNGEIMEA